MAIEINVEGKIGKGRPKNILIQRIENDKKVAVVNKGEVRNRAL